MIVLMIMIGFIVAVDCLILSRYIKSYKQDCKMLHDMFVAHEESDESRFEHCDKVFELLEKRVSRQEERRHGNGRKNNSNNHPVADINE